MKNWLPSKHFLDRWAVRFPELDWDAVIEMSRQPGKSVRKKIKRQCPQNAHKMIRNGKLFYLINDRYAAVFVCTTEGVIVTVFPYSNGER